jgi:uncharacterized protein (DUF2252 family)
LSRMSPGVLAPPHEVFTPQEWRGQGRAERSKVPRSSHAEWKAPADRPDPITILERQAGQRVPDLVPIRYGRMAASPFAYYRGAAAPMAWDLAHTPTTGINVQCCGDAHLMNFGMFAAPDRRLVFDVNDFDETLPGPFDWDLKRLAASFAVAAGDNGCRDISCKRAARKCAQSYREEITKFAAMRFLDVWYSRIDIQELTAIFDALQPKRAVRRRQRDIRKAMQRTSLAALTKFCEQLDDGYRIKPDYPVIVRYPIDLDPAVFDELHSAIGSYLRTLTADAQEVLGRYYFGDFARKVVGVGSVGTEAFILLLMGDRSDEPLFLQLKEAQESVLAPFAGPSQYKHQGERVVRGQRVTQAASDPFLGWTSGVPADGDAPRDYYVRQLRDMKGSMDVPVMDGDQLEYYARICGWALARAHARTGRATLISGYLGSGEVFDHAIADFAVAYAAQNERDYRGFVEAVSSGRVHAMVGV